MSIKQSFINYFEHLPYSTIANLRYGFPSKDLKVIGVTGTDGKTTVTSMIYHLLSQSGCKVGMISTVSAKSMESEVDTGFHVTTPAHASFGELMHYLLKFQFKSFFNELVNPNTVHKTLRLFKDQGLEYVVLETTSQALDQFRLAGIRFDQAVFTNIGNDHLDYHGTYDNYLKAKAKLIKLLKKDGTAIINGDDKSGERLTEISKKLKKKFFIYNEQLIQNYTYSREGIKFEYNGETYSAPVIGEYNLWNMLAAIVSTSQFLEPEDISKSFLNFQPPEGRMQIMLTEPIFIIIDFAHTPGALKEALKSVQKLRTSPEQRIISVFGCAGKRDKDRRDMGKVSMQLADITILTAEDPRDELLKDVNSDIFSRAETLGAKLRFRFANHEELLKHDYSQALTKGDFVAFDEDSPQSRIDAINFALRISRKGDIVFITGKGHERSLSFGKSEKELEWNEQRVVKEAISIKLNNK
ncbi:hypothetical protein KC660_03990 [Candidatus Dojkabacteria bacterium]|uniref:UDP-N-acetylmuramoyl-L-alanyl-D-glutamate--2, 6-diaminopimelate ligase n=1 Tax=Candidatus Dojkabacteria bacterium TaxID=2099670 RepID=A0A955L3Z8_9BACT|nr:hypothetical protein [Candidatus Dojkabacteria bacterium]